MWLDRGQTYRLEKGFAAFEAWRDEVLEKEERERHKLDRRIATEEDWVRYGVSGRRKRNVRGGSRGCAACAQSGATRSRAARHGQDGGGGRRGKSGTKVIDAKGVASLRRARDRARLLDPHPSRRPHRHCRSQRRRQDHACSSC